MEFILEKSFLFLHIGKLIYHHPEKNVLQFENLSTWKPLKMLELLIQFVLAEKKTIFAFCETADWYLSTVQNDFARSLSVLIYSITLSSMSVANFDFFPFKIFFKLLHVYWSSNFFVQNLFAKVPS